MAMDTVVEQPTALSKVERVNALLRADEPGNISVDTYGGYTGYDPQSIKDAMNKVFGIGGWGCKEISSEVLTNEQGKAELVVAKVEVWIVGVEYRPDAWGQNRVTKGDIGDARKGAKTDATKKALSDFSIGNRAYLGLLPNLKEQEKMKKESEQTNARAHSEGKPAQTKPADEQPKTVSVVPVAKLKSLAESHYPGAWEAVRRDLIKKFKILGELSDGLIESDYNQEVRKLIAPYFPAKQPATASSGK